MMPDCSICGKPSSDGDICRACESAGWHGYDLTVEDVSGSKIFTGRDTNHFVTGFRAAEKRLLKEKMAEVKP